MSVSTTQRTRWTTSDIALLPDNGTRYEIIDGELYMSRTAALASSAYVQQSLQPSCVPAVAHQWDGTGEHYPRVFSSATPTTSFRMWCGSATSDWLP